jgi:prepilin-type N-terminal cleavage/methylation domain-containing protein
MLLKHPASCSSGRPAGRAGWTLVEMMVALVLGAIILAAVVSTSIALTNTLVAIVNYNDLDQNSRNTLDTMSRDLRNTATVTAISTSSITASNYLTGDIVTYAWDGSSQFTRTFDGTKTLMLTNCDYLAFSGYQRNPTNNFQFVPASTPSEVKLISVSWRCYRNIIALKLNTESVQTAKICIRN